MKEVSDEGSTPGGLVDSEAQGERPKSGVLQREKWANKTEFLLSMAGEIIGLGNVWRFPYLCYKNGGGVFFIPYFTFLFFCGIPVFFLETALGQYTSEGGVTAWRKIFPMFEGVGMASQVIVMYLNIYYILILAWGLFYMFNSFRYSLPWTTCDNYWNSDLCHNRVSSFANPHLFRQNSSWSFLSNDSSYTEYDNYTEYRVIRETGAMSFSPNWDITLCLLLAWALCYFCIWKGIKSTGKVVYFTAVFPYLMLFILLMRGITLPGASEGLKYYLMPDLSKITDPTVWCDAGTQVFFSYAVCQGVLTALGSYNKYNNNCYKDCIALCLLNSGTSIFAGFAVFSILGFMAHELGVAVADIMSAGPGLAFIVYPRALALLPGAQFWSVLFFLMILLLGLDSQFVCVESLATAITDLFPEKLRKPHRRELLVLIIAVVCFLFGLTLVSEGGMVIFQLIDFYGPSGTSLLFIACMETTVIGWCYGADRFYDNIQDMIGYKPFPVLKYCWLFITPSVCWITLLYNLSSQTSLLKDITMPWAKVLAGFLVVTPLMCIPLYILVSVVKNPSGMMIPSSDLRQAKPENPRLSLCGCVILKGRQKPSRADREMMDAAGV